MKISVDTPEELSELESMSDADLCCAVRDGLASFRSAAQDDPGAFKGKPAGPERPGASLAARDRASIAVMAKNIPGYGRLR
jgi:hypothetical protein